MDNDNKQLHEAIDVCRSGRMDHLESDLAPLAQRLEQDATIRQRYQASQDFDAAVRAGLDDVDVPSDLQQRLLQSIEISGKNGVRPRSNRWVIFGALAATAAAALVIVAFRPRNVPLTEADFHLDAVEVANAAKDFDPFNAEIEREFPLPPRDIASFEPSGYWVANERKAVVYKTRDSSARLVVRPISGNTRLGNEFPLVPIGGSVWRAGVCQHKGFAYALLAKSEREYKQHRPNLWIAFDSRSKFK